MCIILPLCTDLWYLFVVISLVLIFIVIIWVDEYKYVKENYPKMKIYSGKTLIKDSYAPSYENFRKYLEKLGENESLEITTRNSRIAHPINDLLSKCYCPLDDYWQVLLVGCIYSNSIYLTIGESLREQLLVRCRLGDYINSRSKNLSDREFRDLRAKNWWKMEFKKMLPNSERVYTITRTTLPNPTNQF